MERTPKRRLREPGTEQSTGLLTREQEQWAARIINAGLEAAKLTGTGIDATTARIIAATLHTGYGTTLEHFAATGALNPAHALAELDDGQVEPHQIPWLTALWDFLERITDPNPDQAEGEHNEPYPQVFIQALHPELGLQPGGQWIDATIGPDELREQMAVLITDSETPGAQATVSAWVGFHQLSLPADITADQIVQHARGIQKLGEVYALYAAHIGYPVTIEDVLARHEGTYESMIEFIAASPRESIRHALSHADPHTHAGRELALADYERMLRRHHLCLEGRDGIHIYTREYGAPERAT